MGTNARQLCRKAGVAVDALRVEWGDDRACGGTHVLGGYGGKKVALLFSHGGRGPRDVGVWLKPDDSKPECRVEFLDEGSVDADALRALLERLLAGGGESVVPVGGLWGHWDEDGRWVREH